MPMRICTNWCTRTHSIRTSTHDTQINLDPPLLARHRAQPTRAAHQLPPFRGQMIPISILRILDVGTRALDVGAKLCRVGGERGVAVQVDRRRCREVLVEEEQDDECRQDG